MASLNRVVLVGNLTRDPDVRSTPNGTSVTNFGLAVNRRWTNKQGERVDGVDYFNIVTWGKLAELCGEYIKKGSPVALEGRLQSRSWETEDGQKRSVVEIVAENVQFLGRAGSSQSFQDSTERSATLSESANRDNPPDIDLSDIDLGNDLPF
ncbi:MAG: single-stranded DNA-binding protein [Actinobacteria bacterium]|nr:single-stranded DNA-binding protein [Actinomycetota bacterium]